MKLKELCDLLYAEVRFGECIEGAGFKFHASIRRLDIIDDGIRRHAIGFGNTKAKALAELVKALQGQVIEHCPTPVGGWQRDVRLNLYRTKLKPGKVSDFK